MKTNLKIWLVMAVFLSAMAGTSFGAKIIYVDADANGLNNGSSWGNAYKYLQDGLGDANSSAKPIEIRVAQETYRPDEDTLHPDGTGDRMAAFQLINGVTIKGGYAGFGEPNSNARDIALYQTILSGDIGAVSDNNDNCYHVFYHPEGLNLDDTAILDGFTITGGNANGDWPHYVGGGMCNYLSSPTVNNCTFSGNSASWGGGGMFNDYRSSPTVNNCTFSGNSAYGGGGMYNPASTPSVNNCSFSRNAAEYGGGMDNYGYSSSPSVKGCTFTANSAYGGGGMHNFYYSPTVNNCTFSENSANYGGGMCNDYESSATLTNCTIADNNAPNGPAMACDSYQQSDPSNITMLNCVIWNGSDWLWNNDNSTIDVNYSDIQGGWPGPGNIDADPCFVEPDNNDFHLLADSPCINAGDPNYVPEPNETDIDGEARIMWETVDMGADEFNPIRFVDSKRTRISRTEFLYDCNVTFTNLCKFAIKNVQLEMLSVPDNMDINEPNVSFGEIEFSPHESIRSIDTCTFQVDRSQAIEPAEISWRVSCTRADTGMPIELTVGGVDSSRSASISSDFLVQQQSDFSDLSAFAGRWLWTGPAGQINEDVVPDGTVNLADFAEFAAKWGSEE